jgi:hypothetical protein
MAGTPQSHWQRTGGGGKGELLARNDFERFLRGNLALPRVEGNKLCASGFEGRRNVQEVHAARSEAPRVPRRKSLRAAEDRPQVVVGPLQTPGINVAMKSPDRRDFLIRCDFLAESL